MQRFFLPDAQAQGNILTLTDREAHHALQVVRVQRGERVVVLDGAGGEFMCEVRETDRHSVRLAVTQRNSHRPLPCPVTLAQALTKGKTMDLIVQKAAELGTHRIVPVLAERSVSQPDEESSATKVEKWRTVAIEAIKQCGSTWLPKIDVPTNLAKLLSTGEKCDLTLLASLQNDARHPRECLENFRAEHRSAPRNVCVWIGPEGDFTPAEIHSIKTSGALPIGLGPLVLRSETAAIYALSILNYELQTNVDPF